MASPGQTITRSTVDTREVLWPVAPMLVGVGLLMGANGLLASLVGLRASFEGFRGVEIGMIASAHFAGFLVGARLGATWIRRVGHVRAFAAFASTASMMVLVHVLAVSVPVWVVARLLVGACVAGLLVTIESWINRNAPSAARGRVLSTYMVVNVGCYAAGQALLLAAPIESFELFAVVSILLSAALLPVILARRTTAEVVEVHRFTVRQLVARAPAAAVAAAMAGLTWGTVAGWSPVVAATLGLRGVEISAFIGAFMVGHLLVEPIVGAVSDRFDRRIIATTIASVATAAAVTAAVAGTGTGELIVLGGLIGGAAFPLYSLSIALAGDHLRREEMVSASGALVRINGVGAAAGPVLASIGTDAALGLYTVVALGTGVTALAGVFALLRAGYRPPRSPYVAMIARGSVTATRASLTRATDTVRSRRSPS